MTVVDVPLLERTVRQRPWPLRTELLNSAFLACLEGDDLDAAARVLGLYSLGLVDEGAIELSGRYIRRRREQGWKVTAAFDPSSHRPAAAEIVIYYGNYPHSVECLPATPTAYRHPAYFGLVEHTDVAYHPSWEPVARIYVLTTEPRVDRYFHLLLELCRVGAPLHRIHKHCGAFTPHTGDPTQDRYICASENHADVTADFVAAGHRACLVLEDDFSFISDTRCVHDSLAALFASDRDFYVCFLSYSKWGPVDECDELVSFNRQACTTSSGYLLRRETAPVVLGCQREGVEQMKKGRPPSTYCCDRYWARYNAEGRMLCFRRKLGFQYVTHSDIVNRANIHFD